MGLDTVELVLEAERTFGVAVPDDLAQKTETVEEFAHLLYELKAKTSAPMPYEDVLIQLQRITSEMFHLPIERVVPKARFVKDLGLDQ
ncbi:hypothetical protein A7976_14305 [Methylobacillus sp. MM3]|jgi:hypothetical protein|uniref:hypothetical protein n=1 Tax=Methylobacillus sp. MM3 TaxID=1848039 RepID=UPI0007E03DA7|nr:hypothetical protein [Methylobacillus sp. MM3]OAJ69778.1 hypothetical protein A7976_14305 [Methylobacillus sp. MM3]